MQRTNLRHLLWITVAALLVFFTNLGVPRLWDDDEPKNAECAREMFAGGDWVVPTFNDELRYDKPVLLYWLMMAAYQTFGVHEFAARFPSAVLAVVTTLATYHLGRLLFQPRVGLWAALAMSTSVLFVIAGRAATPDSTLICSTTLAMLAFVSATWGARRTMAGADTLADFVPKSWIGWATVYAAMGVGVLAKGPAAVVPPIAVIGLYLLCAKQWAVTVRGSRIRWWKRSVRALSPRACCEVAWQMRPWTALAVVAAIALPWYLAVGLRSDGDWLAGYLGTHNIGRFLKPMEGHQVPIVYYIPAVALGFFPWSVFLPLGLSHLARRARRDPAWAAYVFVACWAGLYIGFFSFSRTKLPSYVLPAYPALALIVAAFVEQWLREPATVRRWLLWPALGTIAVAGVGLLVGLPLAAARFFPGESALGLIGVAPLAGGLAAICLAARRPQRAALTVAVMAVVFVTALFGFGAVQVFYARQRVQGCFDAEGVRKFFKTSADPYLITRADQLDRLRDVLPRDVEVVARQRCFLRSGDVVLLGRVSRTARSGTPGLERK
ncbi:MAG TPA: glycosyltransferase family 39 protein [Pirellulales bacterium]|nr:glycosyltransferase family 39 protein [Pirellulales bacterium]